MRFRSSTDHTDRVAELLLFAATVLYLSALPHNLGAIDESNLLYEAQRVANGEVPYRDVFEIITPLSLYLVAFAYRLLGTDIATARVLMAATHGVTVIALYASCRRLGVRRSLGLPVALAFIAWCQPVWPYVSAHWFGTCFVSVFLWLALQGGWARSGRAGLALGAVAGLVVATQQQKGVVMTAALCALCVIDRFLGRRFGDHQPWRVTARHIAMALAGVVVVAGGVLGVTLIMAGPWPMYEALVVFPLVNYRSSWRVSWGNVALGANYATYTLPALLRYAPAVYLITVPRLVALWIRRFDQAALRRLTVVVVCGGAAALSVSYYPDLIHLAFIAPVFFVAGAEVCEWALQRLPPALDLGAGVVVSLALTAATVWQLQHGMARSWGEVPVSYETDFGRIEMVDRMDIPLYDALRQRLQTAATREIFSYPSISTPYLFVSAQNPTRYQFFSNRYNTAAQAQEIVAILETRQVPHVLLSWFYPRNADPVVEYVHSHYEHVKVGSISRLLLFRRKPDPGDGGTQ